MTGWRLEVYDLREFYDVAGGDLLVKVREDIKNLLRGGDAENAHLLTQTKPSIFNPLEQLHAYMNQIPYLTSQQARLLEEIITSITTLVSTPIKTGKYTLKTDYMSLKLRLARETARMLTQRLAPIRAYIPIDGPKGIDRVAWTLMVSDTSL
jgi:hypothetical protein